MLPNETEFKQIGVLPGEQVDMTFDENSLGFLADILINMYSDKEMAVIREYSTNARDSHIRAGIDRPIEITTPSYLSYFFKVKDYGIGMSRQDIIDIYSKYGASTKRVRADENGLLGIGAKSGLTYTDQFTIVAVKDGAKINVAVSRAVDGGGSMTILSETQTTEPNGVEIVIPVTRNNSFEHKCQKFFQYWDASEVLINGKPPRTADLNKLTDRIHLKSDVDYYDKPIVVMGGVPYEINQDQIRMPNSLVAFVEIGTVAFQPNREYLHYTPKTISALNGLKEEYRENLVKTVQKEVDEQPTRLEAIKKFNSWRRLMRNEDMSINPADITYQGEAMKFGVYLDYQWIHGRGIFPVDRRERNIVDLETAVIVYGFESDKLTPYQKQKLNLWASENGHFAPVFYFCKEVPGDGWLDDITQVKWETITSIKISRGPKGPRQPKAKPEYDIYCNGKFSTVTDLDTAKPILYSTKTDWKQVTAEGNRSQPALPEIQFVFVGLNRRDKFLKAFPSAKPLRDGLKEQVQIYIDNLTETQKSHLRSDQYVLGRFNKLDRNRVKDPELIDILAVADIQSEVSKLQRAWDCLCELGYEIGRRDMYDMFKREANVEWVYDRYPLIDVLIQRAPWNASVMYWDHVYLYLNTVYEMIKGV